MKSKILWQYTAILFLSIIFTSCKKEISQTEKALLIQDDGLKPAFVTTCTPSGTHFFITELLPQARCFAQSIGLGNKVLLVGGYAPNDLMYSRVDIYNTTTNSWTGKSLPEAKFGQGIAAAGTKIGIAGGSTKNPYANSNRVDIFDVNTNVWTSSQLSSARVEVTGVGYGNFLYFAGGFDTQLRKTIDVYNTLDGSWTKLNMSIARDEVTAAAANNKILFAGGQTSTGVTDRVDIYDVPTATWSVSALSKPRTGMVGAAAGNLIIFGGGNAPVPPDGEIYDIVDIYNTTTGRWSVAHIHGALDWFASASQGTKMFFGGFNSYSGPSKADVYDVCLNSWGTLSLSDGRGVFSIGAAGSKVVFAGGKLNDQFVATTDIFTIGGLLVQ